MSTDFADRVEDRVNHVLPCHPESIRSVYRAILAADSPNDETMIDALLMHTAHMDDAELFVVIRLLAGILVMTHEEYASSQGGAA